MRLSRAAFYRPPVPPVVLAGVALAVCIGIVRIGLRTYGRLGELIERATLGVLTLLLFLPMWVHRKVFDPLFLKLGRYPRR